MNIIWILIVAASLLTMIITGNASTTLGIMLGSTAKSLTFSFSMTAVYCLWMGLLKIAEDCRITDKCGELLSPLTTKLFGKITDKARALVTLSLSANMLGLSSAATPFSIAAVEEMDKTHDSHFPSASMAMLFVINTSGVSLLPTTVMGMRAAAGSVAPADILLPTFIVTLINTVVGIFIVRLVYKDEFR